MGLHLSVAPMDISDRDSVMFCPSIFMFPLAWVFAQPQQVNESLGVLLEAG